MKVSEVKEHIAQYLTTVDAPGIERCELQQIESTSDTDAGILVHATVDVYVRIGECDVLRFPQRATFVLELTTSGIFASTTHNWSDTWDEVWAPQRESYLSAARADVEEWLGPYDDANLTHFAALLLLLSDEIGPHLTLLARLTGRAEAEIEPFAARFREAAIWAADSVSSEAWHKSGGQVDFIMDALVGSGRLKREWLSDKVAYGYSLTELGAAIKRDEDQAQAPDQK